MNLLLVLLLPQKPINLKINDIVQGKSITKQCKWRPLIVYNSIMMLKAFLRLSAVNIGAEKE